MRSTVCLSGERYFLHCWDEPCIPLIDPPAKVRGLNDHSVSRAPEK